MVKIADFSIMSFVNGPLEVYAGSHEFKIAGGGSPAFCRSLHQMGQCGSGKMGQNVLLQLKIA